MPRTRADTTQKASATAAAPTPGTLRERLVRRAVRIQGKDGRSYVLRPIVPTDAPSMIRGYEALSPRERWFRLLRAMPELTPEAAVAFSTPDPARDVCLVIEGQEALAGEVIGGARIAGEPNGRDGEFAVSMRPEAQGLGLARQALATALDVACEMGYRRVYGYISAKNEGMRQLAKRLGFTVRRDPDDFTQLIAEIRLVPLRCRD